MPRADKFLLLVSGGPDSVYLFHEFLARHGHDFAVLHVNHGLRGEASDGDESFVADLCARHGVTFHSRRLDPQIFEAGNLQDIARRARLRFCFELQRDAGINVAVTAHHADDWLETLVMRQQRGSGISGLCGIRERSVRVNPLLPEQSLVLFRPLLNKRKSEILFSLRERNIPFRIDASNATDKYLRNRVRSHLDELVSAKDQFPLGEILSLSRALQICDDALRRETRRLLRRYRHFVPIEIWDSWPEEIRFRFFARRMRQNGFHQQVDKRHFERAFAHSRTKQVLGSAYFLKDESGCYFYSRRALLEFKRPRRVSGVYWSGILDAPIHPLRGRELKLRGLPQKRQAAVSKSNSGACSRVVDASGFAAQPESNLLINSLFMNFSRVLSTLTPRGSAPRADTPTPFARHPEEKFNSSAVCQHPVRENAYSQDVILSFAGEFGTLPLKSTFVFVGDKKMSLKTYCERHKVPYWRRRFLPVVGAL